MILPPSPRRGIIALFVFSSFLIAQGLPEPLRPTPLAASAPFSPASLRPAWQLDAQANFRKVSEGKPVIQWRGKGIKTLKQMRADSRPIYSRGAVVFDGKGDHLTIPMWKNGVGQDWTVAALLKLREGAESHHALFGGDDAANFAMRMVHRDGGVYGFVPGYTSLVPPEMNAFTPNDNWRILIVRSDGTKVTTHLDWYRDSKEGAAAITGRTGNFVLGAGNVPATSSSPVSLRYLAYFPSYLSDEDTDRMTLWLEEKKGVEYPPAILFYGGGQSNYMGTQSTLRRELPLVFGNVAFAFGDHYGASPLNLWMKDDASGTGFEICPFYDLSAAPLNTSAYYIGAAHSGTKVIDSWNLRATAVDKNPVTKKVCIFIQGETDCGDATRLWQPNGNGFYNLRHATPYWLADTYGARSLAWFATVREQTGSPEMTIIAERIAFSPGYLLSEIQIEAGHRQRRSQLDSLAQDPRYLLVDTTEFPRFDGVHFSSPDYQAAEIPNTGTERFTRATVRLVNASDQLATLSYHARMLAMRAIDCGFTLDAAGFAACEALAATPGFTDLRCLVIPTLTSPNPIDQERLKRCNLLVHLGDKYATGFVAAVPKSPTATSGSGALTAALATAINTLLEAWQVPGAVSVIEEAD